MHELSLAQGIVELVEAQARVSAFTKVKSVRVLVGALAAVEPDALLFGFDSVAKGTIADGATLVLERPPGAAQCMGCGATVTLESRTDPCSGCGSHQLLITQGDELRVADLEVE